jgi:ubiquinone/menaquinone biosynthesis C-methylase UbiE
MNDDSKRMEIQKEYDQTASTYDRDWSYYIKSTSLETLQRMELSAEDHLLDIGCGTGYFLKLIRSSGFSGSALGLDLSVNMLKKARQTSERTIFLGGQSEVLPFRDDSFTVVVCNNAFHFFLEPRSFLRDVHRVLKDGGKLYVTDWDDEFWACWLCDYYLRFKDPAHTKVYGADELRALVTAEDFQGEFIESYKIDWLWGLMTLKATV